MKNHQTPGVGSVSDDLSEPEPVFDTAGMVNVKSTNSASNAKITFSSFDKSKEDYMRQFSEKVNSLRYFNLETCALNNEIEKYFSTIQMHNDMEMRF